jgi:pentose-5-phosphate-3-epimerase
MHLMNLSDLKLIGFLYISIYLLDYIDHETLKISPAAVIAVNPGVYSELIPRILNFQDKIQKMKFAGGPLDQNEIDRYIEEIQSIRAEIAKFQKSLPQIIEYDRNMKATHRNDLRNSAIMGILGAIIGAAAVFFINTWFKTI